MAGKTVKLRAWTKEDIRALKALAREKTKTTVIARKLKRSVGATHQKAMRLAARRNYFACNAIGGYPFVGTPDRVADELAAISEAGMRGIAVSFINFLDEVPYFAAEVLPRLVRLGVRTSAACGTGRISARAAH